MKSRKLTVTLFILYLLVLSWIILLKTGLSFAFLGIRISFVSMDIKRSINLIPFGGMLILNGLPDYNEIILNGLAFVPFGILLCMLRKKKSFANLIAPIILTSLLFEVIEYIFAIGASDITDVMANTIGGIVGIGIFSILHKMCKENVYKVINTVALVLAIGCALFIGLALFIGVLRFF
jgi:glycopeptide antibiotics resistance protein